MNKRALVDYLNGYYDLPEIIRLVAVLEHGEGVLLDGEGVWLTGFKGKEYSTVIVRVYPDDGEYYYCDIKSEEGVLEHRIVEVLSQTYFRDGAEEIAEKLIKELRGA